MRVLFNRLKRIAKKQLLVVIGLIGGKFTDSDSSANYKAQYLPIIKSLTRFLRMLD